MDNKIIETELNKIDELFGQEDPYIWSTYILPNGHFLNPENAPVKLEPDFGWAYEHEDFDNKCGIALYKYCMKMNVTYPYIELPYEAEWTAEQQEALSKIIKARDQLDYGSDLADIWYDSADIEYIDGMKCPLVIVTRFGNKVYDLELLTADEIIRDINKALIRKHFNSSYLNESVNELISDKLADTLGKNTDGTLKVFYHGTDTGIKEFNPEWPLLTWFADRKSYVTEQYNDNAIEVHLNYKNPLKIVDYQYAYVYPVLEAEAHDIEIPLDRYSPEMLDILKALHKNDNDLKQLIDHPSSAAQVDSFRYDEDSLGELTITALANTPMFKQWMIEAGYDALIAPDGKVTTIGIVDPKNIYILTSSKN